MRGAVLTAGLGVKASAERARCGLVLILAIPFLLVVYARVSAAVEQAMDRRVEVSGRVVDQSGRPLARVVVSILGMASAPAVTTGKDGKFALKLAPGRYLLVPEKPGYVAPSGRASTQLEVGLEASVFAELILWQTGVIGGVIRDESGEPAAGVRIRLLRAKIEGGTELFELTAEGQHATSTDDRGEFRLSGLVPGKYMVVALPTKREEPVPSATFRLPAFYPGAASIEDAAIVLVVPGSHLTNLDFALQFGSFRSIRGRLIGIEDGRAPRVRVLAVGSRSVHAELEVAVTTADPAGQFRFEHLPSGDYVLSVEDYPWFEGRRMIVSASPSSARILGRSSDGPRSAPAAPASPTLWAEVPVRLDDEDIDVAITLSRGARVCGRLAFRGATAMPSAQQLGGSEVWVLPDRTSKGVPPTAVGPTGEFCSIGLPYGRYYVAFPKQFEAWRPKAITHGGVDVTDEGFMLTADAAQQIVIEFSDRSTTLSGRVIDASGRPAPAVTVVVFPADQRRWRAFGPMPLGYREVQAGQLGTYRVADLPPGRYFVAVLPRELLGGEWMVPSVLSALATRATELQISSGEHVTRNLATGRVR